MEFLGLLVRNYLGCGTASFVKQTICAIKGSTVLVLIGLPLTSFRLSNSAGEARRERGRERAAGEARRELGRERKATGGRGRAATVGREPKAARAWSQRP